MAREVLDALRGDGRSVGKLHTELCSKNGMDRDAFEELMGAMARAGLVRLVDAVFEKDGKQIPFRKASLTRDAEYVDEDTPLELSIRGSGDCAGEAGARGEEGEGGFETRRGEEGRVRQSRRWDGETRRSRC